jgi:hypothetical protein
MAHRLSHIQNRMTSATGTTSLRRCVVALKNDWPAAGEERHRMRLPLPKKWFTQRHKGTKSPSRRSRFNLSSDRGIKGAVRRLSHDPLCLRVFV